MPFKIKSRLSELVETGISSDMPEIDARYVRLTNTIVIFISVVLLLYLPVFAVVRHPLADAYIVINILEFLLFLPTLKFNADKRYGLATFWFISTGMVMVLVASYVFGNDSGVYFYLLTMAVVPVFIFGRRFRYLTIVFAMIGFGSFLFFESMGPIEPAFGDPFSYVAVTLFYYVNMAGLFLIILGLAFYSNKAGVDAERALEKARLSAESGQRSRARFLAMMSHEIRTPLNSIIGFGQLLQRPKTREGMDQNTNQMVDYIVSGAESLSSLLGNILDLTRLDEGKMTNNPRPVQISKIFENLRMILSAAIKDRGIDLVLDIQDQGNEWIVIDELKMNHILVNLLSNAVKFSNDDGRVLVEVKLFEGRGVIVITDQGAGIAQDELEQIFEPFERLELSNQERRSGTGLGLAIARGMVEAIGAALSVQSEVGIGSVFTVSFPFDSVPDSEQLTLKEQEPMKQVQFSADTPCLVVDDSEANVALLRRLLQQHGLHADSVSTGEDALEYCKNNQPALIFLDLHLPAISGFDVVREFNSNELYSTIDIVLVTADINPEHQQVASDLGILSIIPKPIDEKLIVDVLSRVLTEVPRQYQ